MSFLKPAGTKFCHLQHSNTALSVNALVSQKPGFFFPLSLCHFHSYRLKVSFFPHDLNNLTFTVALRKDCKKTAGTITMQFFLT